MRGKNYLVSTIIGAVLFVFLLLLSLVYYLVKLNSAISAERPWFSYLPIGWILLILILVSLGLTIVSFIKYRKKNQNG